MAVCSRDSMTCCAWQTHFLFCLFVCLSVYWSACLSVYLFACLHVWLALGLCVCLGDCISPKFTEVLYSFIRFIWMALLISVSCTKNGRDPSAMLYLIRCVRKVSCSVNSLFDFSEDSRQSEASHLTNMSDQGEI